MKTLAIVYGKYETHLQRKAVEALSCILQEQTVEFPACFSEDTSFDKDKFLCIHIGTKATNSYIAQKSDKILTAPEEYAVSVDSNEIIIEGYDDLGVLYGCMDFYNCYIAPRIAIDSNGFKRCDLFSDEIKLPEFSMQSAPKIKERGIWTWGHVIYDYKGFIENMAKLKMNTLIMWNDFVPLNIDEVVDYAHMWGVKVILGYPWLWDNTDFTEINFSALEKESDRIVKEYEENYKNLNIDGIYFQSFTELSEEKIGDVLVAEAVCDFVNKTAAKIFEISPDLRLQFGLHATSVDKKLEYIANVDKRIEIIWEDCGAMPFHYDADNLENFDETLEFTKKITKLRGEDEKFGAVTKSFVKLDWFSFIHQKGRFVLGVSSPSMHENRIARKRAMWRTVQASWLKNAEKARETISLIRNQTSGNTCITALIEDGMFEKQIFHSVALMSEILWNPDLDTDTLSEQIALRSYIDFA